MRITVRIKGAKLHKIYSLAQSKCSVNMNPHAVHQASLPTLPPFSAGLLHLKRKHGALCKSHARGGPAELCPSISLRASVPRCSGDCTSQQTWQSARRAGARPEAGVASPNQAVSPHGTLTLCIPAGHGPHSGVGGRWVQERPSL